MVGPTCRRVFEKGPHRDASDVTPTSLSPAPKMRERAVTSVDRVLAWKRDLGDRRQGAIVVRCAGPAFVITAEGRIRADHEQILAGGKPLVAGPGRQDHHVAGLELKLFSAFATEANPWHGRAQHRALRESASDSARNLKCRCARNCASHCLQTTLQ